MPRTAICKDNIWSRSCLTEGKEYEIINENSVCLQFINDRGIIGSYDPNRFIIKEDTPVPTEQKILKKVICVNAVELNRSTRLTEGKEYQVIDRKTEPLDLSIIDDTGKEHQYLAARFKDVQPTSEGTNAMTLTPCPFCNGTPDLVTVNIAEKPTRYRLFCKGCKIQTKHFKLPEKATEFWNQRANQIVVKETLPTYYQLKDLFLVFSAESEIKNTAVVNSTNHLFVNTEDEANKEAEICVDEDEDGRFTYVAVPVAKYIGNQEPILFVPERLNDHKPTLFGVVVTNLDLGWDLAFQQLHIFECDQVYNVAAKCAKDLGEDKAVFVFVPIALYRRPETIQRIALI